MITVGVVFAAGTKALRRIIKNSQELSKHGVVNGESMLIGDVAENLSPEEFLLACENLVQAATGVKPADPRCAVVNGLGLVVEIIKADPAIDAYDRGSLVACAKEVTVGDSYNNTTKIFTLATRIAAVPKVINP